MSRHLEASMSRAVRILAALALLLLMNACLTPAGDRPTGKLEPAPEYLDRLREPFRIPTHSLLQGVVYSQPSRRGRPCALKLSVETAWDPEEMRTLVLVEQSALLRDTYRASQTNNPRGIPWIQSQAPDAPKTATLDEMGLRPEDFSFAFIYWPLLKDFKLDAFRGETCRVLELQHPMTGDRVTAWFSLATGFPRQLRFYRKDEADPWRILDFKKIKTRSDGTQVIEELLVHDPIRHWQTLVRIGQSWTRRLGPGETLPDLAEEKPEEEAAPPLDPKPDRPPDPGGR